MAIAAPPAAGTVELVAYRRVCGHGYGNGAPVDRTERGPPPLGNLAHDARFPHSHSRFLSKRREHDEEHEQHAYGWTTASE
jgi:hypothetical protein